MKKDTWNSKFCFDVPTAFVTKQAIILSVAYEKLTINDIGKPGIIESYNASEVVLIHSMNYYIQEKHRGSPSASSVIHWTVF